ncbi:MAG: DUF962 domain-containing protein [Tabrizicola sp.]|nr:DUF962 domain-containing protein [Tabrizicola sp.]
MVTKMETESYSFKSGPGQRPDSAWPGGKPGLPLTGEEQAMLNGRSWDDWIAEYAESHRNRWNRLTHTFGIPMIVVAIALGMLAIFVAGLWPWALGLFVLGWALQFIGHAIEGKPPEFFKDWRFLLVGTRWWWKKVTGRV